MITFSGNTIFNGESVLEVEHRVVDAFQIEGRIIVLFDPDSYTERFGQFPNFAAFTPTGERLWIAELPTTNTGDRYYKIASREPLVVYSIDSFECEIDPSTGRIKARRFFK
jgi:hypothetical protein